jgi:hypothetical protein
MDYKELQEPRIGELCQSLRLNGWQRRIARTLKRRRYMLLTRVLWGVKSVLWELVQWYRNILGDMDEQISKLK